MVWKISLGIALVLCANVTFVQSKAQADRIDPCIPSPCGPNTQCSVNSGGAAICRCNPGTHPKPDTITGCGPQCVYDHECPFNEKCHQGKCVPSCNPSPCGVNAECRAENNKAICSCPRGYTGDPLFQCTQQKPIARAIISQPPPQAIRAHDPCSPSPCGQNTECRVSGERPVCTCLPGHFGNPQSFCRRGECSSDNECASSQVCQDYHCISPCTRACGTNANCDVRNHVAVCSCPSGYTGDPTHHCRRYDPNELCQPSPCGQNTKCRVENNRAICSCMPTFRGDPLSGCRHECESDNDCGYDEMCTRDNYKCKKACGSGACGAFANCRVEGHRPVCTCPTDYLGDPYNRCYPECTSHSECPANRACIGLKCQDPCIGACGINAECRVDKSNHKAICSCPRGYTGHPFDQCRRQTPEDLCRNNPCGTNAICTPGHDNTGKDRPVCTCPPGYFGNALQNCRRGECQSDGECPNSRICTNYNCVDPCISACGTNARCEARNHGAVCSCPAGYKGDPFHQCSFDPIRAKRKADDEALPAPDDKEVELPEVAEKK